MANVNNSGKLNLIVLTDFSEAAENATTYGKDLAIAIGADVYLLHIWDNSLLNPDLFINSHPYNSGKKIENALRERSQNSDKALAVKPVLLKGSITDQLPAFIKNIPNALVIIGKRFTENTPDEMVSSTSINLLDNEGISLLIV